MGIWVATQSYEGIKLKADVLFEEDAIGEKWNPGEMGKKKRKHTRCKFLALPETADVFPLCWCG